ncbi:winged helix-turn-helix transcriptional regulator [Aeromicrobium wangtongii]|uniref:Helix-turn-helix transcriptional regulator n=1 Tax=Aeromicrobium wangtongii TaxID=2969247 RepID=A0ABY5M912_9ACTN|nr:helix-turn-helix domain-containing protein [Aeromicrobium wangtongii]MCD9199861.1 helix-turn-helix transcriptional regulator [Aeromicrobium wangtongii]UUP13480.1 helix-turn-helix transcriptional regulator [Aeromicrobium wangtongii]
MTNDVGAGEVEGTASPLGRALVLLGDMWTVRIVRAIFAEQRRFQDLRDSLRISDPVLSRRLRALVDDGLLHTRAYQSNPPRHEYLLTEAGIDLWRVMIALWTWDRTWAGGHHRDAALRLRHHACGHSTRPVFGCGSCGAIGLTARDVKGVVDDRLLLDVVSRRSRRSTAMSGPIDASGVLGDRWSTLILSDALMGSRRFSEFQSHLKISPVTLTQRLELFVETGMLTRESVTAGGRRQEYRLTPKGIDFFSVTATINSWAARWLSEDGESGLSLTHLACGAELDPQFTCNSCNKPLVRREIGFEGPEEDRAGLGLVLGGQ